MLLVSLTIYGQYFIFPPLFFLHYENREIYGIKSSSYLAQTLCIFESITGKGLDEYKISPLYSSLLLNLFLSEPLLFPDTENTILKQNCSHIFWVYKDSVQMTCRSTYLPVHLVSLGLKSCKALGCLRQRQVLR